MRRLQPLYGLVAFVLGFVLTAVCVATSSAAGSLLLPATKIGNGTAHTFVQTDASGNPSAIALVLSAHALDGLPRGDKEYVVPMPPGSKTGFDHVTIDWNAHGHAPPHVYDVPHFDFHFYTVSVPQQMAVVFPKGEKDPAGRVTDRALVPAGYTIPPDTAVPMMGVHAIDPSGPEFAGKFTSTFLYGYYKNKLIFVEPMITRKFLLSHPNATYVIPTPAKYSTPGYYPTKYSVRYDPAQSAYVIELGGLRAFQT